MSKAAGRDLGGGGGCRWSTTSATGLCAIDRQADRHELVAVAEGDYVTVPLEATRMWRADAGAAARFIGELEERMRRRRGNSSREGRAVEGRVRH